MSRHSDIHKSQRQLFECAGCGKLCVSKQAHKTHWLRKHGSLHFEPPKKTSANVPSVQAPTKKSFFCHYCSRGFKRKDNLEAHMYTHGYLKKKFECEVCQKSFAHSSNLKVHLKMHGPKKPAAKNVVWPALYFTNLFSAFTFYNITFSAKT